MGAAHGLGAAQGAAHDDGAALCLLKTSPVPGVSARKTKPCASLVYTVLQISLAPPIREWGACY